jgi:hypothetical protein
MASAATTRVFEENTLSTLGQKLDSGCNSESAPIVFFISSDISERRSLKSLVAREGWGFETFESAREFLARPRPLVPSCLILGLPPEPNRLEEQKAIVRQRSEVRLLSSLTMRMFRQQYKP